MISVTTPDELPERPPPAPLRITDSDFVACLCVLVDEARDVETIGRRALAMAWLAGALPECSTQADLARRMKVSRAAASKILAKLTTAHRRNAA